MIPTENQRTRGPRQIAEMNYSDVRCQAHQVARFSSTYKKPTRVSSVEIDADSKDGQVVDPNREMQFSDMVALLGRGVDSCSQS